MESLDLIFKRVSREVGKISKMKHLQRTYDWCEIAERKRKREDRMRKIGVRTVSGLRAFIYQYKTEHKQTLKKSTTLPPMPLYEEQRKPARLLDTSFSPESLFENFTGRPPEGAYAWTRAAMVHLGASLGFDISTFRYLAI